MRTTRPKPNRWLVLVLINSGLIQAGVYVVRPMTTYEAVNLGADATVVGIIGAAFALAPLIFAIQVGRWIDRGNAGRAMFFGSLVSLAATISLIFVEQVWLLMLVMPVLGIGHLLVMSGGQTLVGNLSEDKKYERNFGLLTFYASLGHALGPLLGGVLADRGGLEVDVDSAFMFAVGLFLVAAIGVMPKLMKLNESKSSRKDSPKGSPRKVFAIPQFKSAIFVAGAITAVIDVMLVFLPLLGRELGFSASQVGALLAIRAVAAMLVRIILGPLTNRLGMRWSLSLGAGVTVITAILIAISSDFWVLAVLMFIAGFSTGIGQPVTMAWVTRITPQDVRGLAIAIRLTSNRFGQVLIPSIAGLFAASGAGTIFWLLAALQAVSYLVSERALGKRDAR